VSYHTSCEAALIPVNQVTGGQPFNLPMAVVGDADSPASIPTSPRSAPLCTGRSRR
jgi:hypothetical protein